MRTYTAGLILILFAFYGMISDAAQANGGYMTGRITHYNGNPARSLAITISQNGTVVGRSLSGDDGKFFIPNLPDGTYDITIQRGTKKLFTGQIRLPENRVTNVRLKSTSH